MRKTEMALTAEQHRSVRRALGETKDALDRETALPPEQQKPHMIEFYRRHVDRLSDILDGRREMNA
jgi:hypothetical protein